MHGAHVVDLKTESSPLVDQKAGPPRRLFSCGLAIFGPGVLCALADTDAACLLVASDSGARYGYSALILLQIMLIVPLFLAQELTVRLGVHTGLGQGACIRRHYGPITAWVSFALLAVTCVLAIVSELSGIAGVADVMELPPTAGAIMATAVLLLIVVLPYRLVEAVGTMLGLFELSFVVAWAMSRPSASEFISGLGTVYAEPEFWSLAAANVGAVVMPWMIFFQQSAIAARGLRAGEAEATERSGTLIGSMTTQLIMVATMASMAATRALTGVRAVEDARDMSMALTAALGDAPGKMVLALGLTGGSTCATIVVALAASWALCDAMGLDTRSANPMDKLPWEAPSFYACYVLVVLIGLAVQLGGVTQESISIAATVANALLMSSTLAFLWLLACGPAMPEGVRVTGMHKWACAAIFAFCSCFAAVAVGLTFVPSAGMSAMPMT